MDGSMNATNADVKNRLNQLYDELFHHDGYGRIEVELKILRRGQKEVIVRCGKEYRFVIDYPEGRRRGGPVDPADPPQPTPSGAVRAERQ